MQFVRLCKHLSSWVAGAMIALPVLAFIPSARAADDKADIYLRDIKPVLRERCYACHGALKQESGLRVDTAELMLDYGALVPGDTAGSLLVERISSADDGYRMPPEGQPLTAEQIQLITRWIEAGAPVPPDEKPEQDPAQHWAFQKPVRPKLPEPVAGDDAPPLNPIDLIIDQQRAAAKVDPLPMTDRATLLRRVYLDLVGVPPTAEELNAFLSDESPRAYEDVVNRLLESPQHGERWARHWMDIWRYSDWYGRRAVPDVMNSYPMIWRWRDWIVRSINEDKPYDQMIREMLAADEIMPDDEQNIVATGYLVRSWFKWNYETWKKDLVEHTGKAFLGLTLNCAQCHDHKYDPLTHEEYFRFRAFFEPLELHHQRVAGEPDPGPFVKYVYGKPYGPISSGLVRVFDEYLTAETYMFLKGDARLRIEGKPPVSPGVPAVLNSADLEIDEVVLPITSAYPGMKAFIRAEERAKREAAVAEARQQVAQCREAMGDAEREASDPASVAAQNLAAAEARLVAAESELASLEKRIAADDARYSTGLLAEDRKGEAAVDELIHAAWRSEREAALALARSNLASIEAAAALARQQEAEAAERGDQAAIDAVKAALLQAEQQKAAATLAIDAAIAELAKEPGEYTPLSPKYPQVSTGRRTALAHWITNEANPLTARVAVNHIWLRHFGQALVSSTHDFGRNGTLPTHPELLDWLACELMDSGWSMKHIHRLIVTSKTHRRASMLPRSRAEERFAASAAADPENLTYWRFPEARMQAEVVRDSLLSVAEELDTTMGGHEIDHRQGMTSRRRSIYFAYHGEEKMEFLELFDAANPMDCYKRTSSVQPQQALALTNSELTKTLSRQLAPRLWTRAQVNGAPEATPVVFTPATGENDAHTSADANRRFVQLAFLQVLNRAPNEAELAASLEFLEQQPERLRSALGADEAMDPAARSRANLIHALMNHNDFVTIR